MSNISQFGSRKADNPAIFASSGVLGVPEHGASLIDEIPKSEKRLRHFDTANLEATDIVTTSWCLRPLAAPRAIFARVTWDWGKVVFHMAPSGNP